MLLFQLWDVAATTRDGESLLLLYGRASVADGGQDVCIRVRGFKHYIYIPQPAMTSASSSPVEAIEVAMRRRGLFSNAELVTRTDAVGFNVPANYWKLTLRNHQNVYQVSPVHARVHKTNRSHTSCARPSTKATLPATFRASPISATFRTRRWRRSTSASPTAAGRRLTRPSCSAARCTAR
jgi:hypothetical protein